MKERRANERPRERMQLLEDDSYYIFLLCVCFGFDFETMKMLMSFRLKTLDKLNPQTHRSSSSKRNDCISSKRRRKIYSAVNRNELRALTKYEMPPRISEREWWKIYINTLISVRKTTSPFILCLSLALLLSSLTFAAVFFFSLFASMSTTGTWRITSGKTMKGKGSFGK